MVVVQSKAESSTSSSPLSLSPKNGGENSQTSISFSEVLYSASQKKDQKEVQNGTFVLSLKDKPHSSDKEPSLQKPLIIALRDSKESVQKSDTEPSIQNRATVEPQIEPKERVVVKQDAKTQSNTETPKDTKELRNDAPASLLKERAQKSDREPSIQKRATAESQIEPKERVVVKQDAKTQSSPETLKDTKELRNDSTASLLKESAQKSDREPSSQTRVTVESQIEPKETKERVLSRQSDAPKELPKESNSSAQSLSLSEKKEPLLALLKGAQESLGRAASKEELESQIEDVAQSLSAGELKQLVKDAKTYLKDKITAMQTLSKSEIEALPKTLKGLMQVAQKIGIDVSKVTLERVQSYVTAPKVESAAPKIQTIKELQKSEQPSSIDESKTEQTLSKSKESQSTQELPLEKKSTKPAATKEEAIVKQDTLKQEFDKEQSRQEPKIAQTKIQETPIFKAQSKTEISTEEMVNAKSVLVDAKKPKERTEERLSMLLQGERATKSEEPTSTLSVATSKILLQSETPRELNQNRGLESLLYGQKEESTEILKSESSGVMKAESLESKMNEAKQMVRYLSNDIKTAIDDYKSPFTRVKVQLNPQRLGEVDLTVVQRGKNLHVTLSSNNAAINTLAMNASDLRLQLVNSGIQNATLNFSNTGQDGTASQQQQQQQNSHQQQNRASQEYNYFENEESNEEILASLEIVVPSYA